jgi:hypothetical protein
VERKHAPLDTNAHTLKGGYAMSGKTRPNEYFEQVAKMLRDIYGKRDFVSSGTRVRLTRWLFTIAKSKGIETGAYVAYKPKAELFLKLAEAGEYVQPFAEEARKVWELAEKEAAEFKPTAEQQKAADVLLRMYDAPRVLSNLVQRGLRNRMSRKIKILHRYVVEYIPGRAFPGPDEPARLYLEACRAQAEGAQTPNLRGRLDEVEGLAWEVWTEWKEIIEPATRHSAESKRESKQKAFDVYEIPVNVAAPHLGFVAGEILEARRADDIKVWDAIAFWKPGEDEADLGRVVAVTADHITVRYTNAEATIARAELEFLGRISPEPIGFRDGLTDEERRRVKELRARLEKIDVDDITNSTAVLTLEREIYNIEHKPAAGDSNDWSAWEEDE